MYIIDLFVNIFKRKKFTSLIWILLNAVVITVCLSFALAIITDGALEDWALILCCFVLYIISVVIALSPVGEAILRWQNGCKKITDPEILSRIEPIFNEVFEKASYANPSFNQKVKIFICDEESPNAFACGRKTVCITKGLLKMNNEEIKGVVAHEFGHLEHKDTDVLLIVTVGNLVVTAIITVIGLIVRIFNWITAFVCSMFMSERGAFITGFLTSKFNVLVNMLFGAIAWLWTKLGVLLCIRASRNDEYEADKYAYEIGFGSQLISSLHVFEKCEVTKSKSLWSMLSATHPETSSRIEKLNSLSSKPFTPSPVAPVSKPVEPVPFKVPSAPVTPTPVNPTPANQDYVYTAPVTLTSAPVKTEPTEIFSWSTVPTNPKPPHSYSEPETTEYPAKEISEEPLSMKFHKFFKSFLLPVSIISSIANLVLQGTDIVNTGVSIQNIICVPLIFSSLVLGIVCIYHLAKEIRGAQDTVTALVIANSLCSVVSSGFAVTAWGNPLLAVLIILATALICVLYLVSIITYYSKRKNFFNR